MANQKPLIALTPYFNIERDEPYMRPAYLKAIRAAGGTPLILPLDLEEDDLLQIVNTFDGFLFTGGPDIHPISGKKLRPTAAMSACAGTVWN